MWPHHCGEVMAFLVSRRYVRATVHTKMGGQMSRVLSGVILIGAMLVSLPCQAASVDAPRPSHMTLVTAALPPLSSTKDKQGFLDQIAHVLFARLNIEVEVNALPGERALINANTGIDDGDMMRAPGFEKAFPNLVRVPEKIGKMDFMAYAMTPGVKINNWADLQSYDVGYASGWKIFERKVKAKDVTVVRSIEALFPLLEQQRVNVILIDRWQGLWEAQRHSPAIHILEPPLASSEMYIYMNKRHAALVPELARQLAKMKADGTYEEIFMRTLQPYEKNRAK